MAKYPKMHRVHNQKSNTHCGTLTINCMRINIHKVPQRAQHLNMANYAKICRVHNQKANMFHLISIDSYAYFFILLSFTPYPYDWGCTDTSIVMAICQPHLFNSCILCLFFFFTYPFMPLYIIDCMYIYVKVV